MIKVQLHQIRHTQQLLLRTIFAALTLLPLGLSALWDPDKVSVFSCLFRKTSGYSCPSCGLTRSFHAMTQLNILEAGQFHLIGPVFFIVLLILFFKFFTELLSNKRIVLTWKPQVKITALIGLAALWILFVIFRFLGEFNSLYLQV